jgi:hypothetical protein
LLTACSGALIIRTLVPLTSGKVCTVATFAPIPRPSTPEWLPLALSFLFERSHNSLRAFQLAMNV